jgi:NosR/NirI family transcriptional regulator, nitrous oxide reductase regulator
MVNELSHHIKEWIPRLVRIPLSISAPPRILMKVLAPVLFTFLILLINAQPVLACNIAITSTTTVGKVGDNITFTINVQKTHRDCITPIDETEIKLKNMEMVSQTLWQKVSSDVNRKQITVRLTKAGEGLLEVIRECSKGGDYETVKVTISESTSLTTSLPQTPSPAPSLTQTPTLTALPETPAVESPESDISWAEAFSYAIKQPNIIAVLAFTTIATMSLMRRYRRLRYLILLASMLYLGFALGGCLCALGALQNVILRVGEIKYRFASYLILGIPVITAMVFGRVFCGWVCPMGAVQHFVFKKETSKKIRSFEPNSHLHDILRYSKYLVLVVLIVIVVITRTTWFSSIDPFKALFNLDFVLLPTIILGVLLIASLVISFPWCKYVCPLGAFLAIFSRYSPFKVKINEKCTNCKACHTTLCDYKAIKPGEVRPETNQMECVRCGECISRCPYNAINFTVH